MKTSTILLAPLLGALPHLSGCYAGAPARAEDSSPIAGSSSTGFGDDGSSSGSSSGTGAPVEPCSTPTPGSSPLRRLTREEYNNTIFDLLGDDSRPAEDFPAEDKVLGFENNAEAQTVNLLLAEAYENAAEAVATTAVADLPALLQCDTQSLGEDACAAAFVDRFGRRAFRRPLSAEERGRHLDFFVAQRGAHDFPTAIRQLLKAILMSPHFLYRIEVGLPEPDAAGVVRLTDYEIATRLAYLFWNTTPDEELMAAAEAGQLGTAEEIRQWAEQMLDDPRGRRALADFQRQWLDLDAFAEAKDPDAYPDFDDGLRPRMRAELDRFWEAIVFDGAGEGTLTDLLTSDISFVDPELAAYYGIELPDGSEGLTEVRLDPDYHAGLLTKGAVVAAHSSPNQTNPVRRGVFVREKVLCQLLPPPPPDINVVPPEPDPNASTRDRFEQHTSDPLCAGCHVLIDDLGFGFEHFDGAGRWRGLENGLPIDASGELVGTLDVDGFFDGVPQLAARLASSEQVRDCFVNQWFRYAYGRTETSDDMCTLGDLHSGFRDQAEIRALLLALTQTDAFLLRRSE